MEITEGDDVPMEDEPSTSEAVEDQGEECVTSATTTSTLKNSLADVPEYLDEESRTSVMKGKVTKAGKRKKVVEKVKDVKSESDSDSEEEQQQTFTQEDLQ